MYRLLGTHNSATGETPSDMISYLLSPIAKCQSKTIKQQCQFQVGLFDLRVKPYHHAQRYNLYYPLEEIQNCTLGHGLCDYNITLQEAITQINDHGVQNNKMMYVLITLEGELNDPLDKFVDDVKSFIENYKQVTLLEINVKKPKWTQYYRNQESNISYTQDYSLIKGWKALFPFPKFWSKFIQCRPQFKNTVYSLRDFV